MRREAEIGQPAPEAAENEASAPRLPSASMVGKRGLIMGVANDRSIAWGLAKSLHGRGAELAFTYQGETFGSRVRPLAESVGSELVLSCDVAQEGEVAAVFDRLGQSWDGLDFVVHALAFSDKEELKGRYLDTSRANFARTLEISCFSFTEIARRAAPLMGAGGSLLTLTYLGAERVTPNYNVMGVAKAALEASVRYLAADLGPDGIRVNAISAGPMRTLAGSAVGSARQVYNYSREVAPLRRNVVLDDVGGAGLYLLSDLSGAVTGEVHYVDCGFNAIGMPIPPENGDNGNNGGDASK
jgi:enoyl-[acyl-carrier protein] reductase I